VNKLWLIIKREYLTRVKKRSFILATILTPIAFALFFIIVGFIFAYESDDARRIAIVDQGNIFENITTLSDENNIHFHFENRDLKTLKDNFENIDYDGILVIPALRNVSIKQHTIFYYSNKQLGLDIKTSIENKIGKSVRDYKIAALGLDKNELESLKTRISLNPEPIDENKKDESSMAAIIAAMIGGSMGMIMYMTVFIYGTLVMRSVMEEKTSRIVEVMISSVKPFQLMMGKIIGVGAVGLTQIAIWGILIPIIGLLVNLIFGFESNSQLEDLTAASANGMDPDDINLLVTQVIEELKAQNWWMIIPLFLFYFLGGYFLYASLFAAVGSAIGDDLGEGQALTIPITIPVVIAFYIMFVAVRAPESNLAVWSSIFPLFSPIVMPARLAFSPPVWQIALSVVTLILVAIFFVWLSARIYRVGILMYGKKVGFKELSKWLFYKE